MSKIKKFIFVSGPSESGKSSGVNYISENFSNVNHLKIKNVYKSLYEKSGSSLEYIDWRKQEIENNFRKHWEDYLFLASAMAEDNEVVIMDTLYSTEDVSMLHDILNERLSLLYVDAPFKDRCSRELARLRVDSTFSDRKADLLLTIEDVMKITERKDSKKQAEGMFSYPDLVIQADGCVHIGGNGKKLVNVIQNIGTEDEFHRKLRNFMSASINLEIN